MSTALSVNLNKVALIRNSREGNFPSLIEFGNISLEGGAQGLTVHPRPDQRHIRPGDVYDLAKVVKSFPDAEFNIEGNPFAAAQGDYPGLMQLVADTQPDQCTLVPDSDDQLTSDHGFDLTTQSERLAPIVEQLHQLGVRVSLFMDPDIEQIKLARELGVARIELYTGPYALNYPSAQHSACLEQYRQAAGYARDIGLAVNAGHDLNLDNLPDFLSIAGIAEVSIGHALTVDALRFGMPEAVARYLQICQRSA